MNPCHGIADLIGPYLYGDLSLAEVELVDQHLGACEQCRHDAHQRTTVLAALTPCAPAADERARILQTVRTAVVEATRARPPSSTSARPALAATPAVALAAALFLAGFWIGGRARPQPQQPAASAVAPPKPQPTAPVVARAKPAAPDERQVRPHLASPTPQPAFKSYPSPAKAREPRPPVPPAATFEAARVVAPVPLGVDDVSLARVEE
jgi:anti-sigma factor RsiW